VTAAVSITASTPALLLATVGADGSPHASYVPFAPLRDGFGIAVSGLAAHTGHLATHRKACVLIVSEVSAADGAYARARMSVDVVARPVPSSTEAAATIWSALEKRHGAVATTLRGLPDFCTFVLEPVQARLVLGFASAHTLDGPTVLEAIRAAQATSVH
jgi:putative heme iron utilization protein